MKQAIQNALLILLGSLLFLLLLGFAFLLIAIAAIGFEPYVGDIWSSMIAFVSGIFRLGIVISVGRFLAVVNYFDWPWYVGVMLAFPGLALFFPVLIWEAVTSFWRRVTAKGET